MIPLFIFFLALLGLVVGSFLNVLTLRIVAGESIVFPASHCPHCKHALAWYDLLPLVSYLFLHGRCRYCRAVISPQYPIVEAATALGFTLVAAQYATFFFVAPTPTIFLLLRDLVFVAGLVALFVFDARWMIVPDEVSLPLIAFAALANLALGIAWPSLAIGIAVGGGFYFLLWAVSRGQWVGSGDIRLGALLGAMFGWPGAGFALYFAYLIGGAAAAALLLSGRGHMKSLLPMGVFLTTGAFLTMMFSTRLLEWWVTTFS